MCLLAKVIQNLTIKKSSKKFILFFCSISKYLNIFYPESISNIRIPSAHKSTDLPYPRVVPLMISGARYSGVPQSVKVLSLSSFLANPKSAIFIFPSLSISRFSGLRSR